MDLPKQLLALANQLAILESPGAEQATLRRAVSTAYYAVFHLLVSATAAIWQDPQTQSAFGRLLDHGKMKTACEKKVAEINKQVKQNSLGSMALTTANSLHAIAESFVELHRHRTNADYDVSKEWSRTSVLSVIEIAEGVFRDWQAVTDTPEAQLFLFSFLAKDR